MNFCTRKIAKKKFGRKTRENVGFFVKIEFLDKNLTFRILYLRVAMNFEINDEYLDP